MAAAAALPVWLQVELGWDICRTQGRASLEQHMGGGGCVQGLRQGWVRWFQFERARTAACCSCPVAGAVSTLTPQSRCATCTIHCACHALDCSALLERDPSYLSAVGLSQQRHPTLLVGVVLPVIAVPKLCQAVAKQHEHWPMGRIGLL